MDEPAVSSSARNRNPPRGHNPAGGGGNAHDVVDRARARREAELAAQHEAMVRQHTPVRQFTPVRPTTSMEPGVTSSSLGIPCLVPALRNVRLPKDFKGPRKVPNYTADLSPESWVESYEMAMEMLDVDDAACAKYFTMMLEGTTRTCLEGTARPVYPEFQGHMQAAHVDCGLSCLCPGGRRVNNPLGAPGFGDFAFIRPHQR